MDSTNHSTHPMLELIQDQFKSGKTLTQSKYYTRVRRDLWPKYHWELYPLAQEYYHELNPYFTYQITNDHFFDFSKTMTVRDGSISFASFLVKTFPLFSKIKCHFIIPPQFAPLVSEQYCHKFSSWKLHQHKKVQLKEAKKVILFTLLCDQYFDFETFESKLEELKVLEKGTELEVFFTLRKNPLEPGHSESLLSHTTIEKLKAFAVTQGFKLKFLTSNQFFEKSDLTGVYLIDLCRDDFLVSDNYLHHYVASRGGTVNLLPSERPLDSFFTLPLSLTHDLHICPLPQMTSHFAELAYLVKKKKLQDPVMDAGFQDQVKKILAT